MPIGRLYCAEASARGPREENESSSAAARACGGGAPRAVIKAGREGQVGAPAASAEAASQAARALASGGGAPRAVIKAGIVARRFQGRGSGDRRRQFAYNHSFRHSL